MKTNAIRMFLALCAASVAGTALHAQSNDLSAKVPFAFQVAGQNLPAGKYVVREYGYLHMPGLQNTTTGQVVFVAGADRALTQTDFPKLVFHCYSGTTCFLAEIRPVSGPGSHVAMTKAEKDLAAGEHSGEMASISIDLRRAD